MTSNRSPRHRGFTAAAVGALLVAPLALATSAAADEPAGPGAPLVTTAGTTWSYLDNNTEPQGPGAEVLAWTAPSFDDSTWKTGTGSFGALRGAIGELSGGFVPDTLLAQYINGTSNPVIPTYFFRTTFELDEASLTRLEALEGSLTFDDAVRVYLNGTLVYNDRDDRASDPTKNLQYAGTSASAPVNRTFSLDPEVLAPGTLVAGTNTLAVTLYQDRESSSDIYLDFSSLVPILGEAPATPPGADEQALQVEIPAVAAGEFVWSIDGSNDLVDLGVAQVAGDRFEASGSINPVRVTDTRLGAPAWSIAGQVSDFVSGGQSIEAKYLGWSPAVTENEGGATAGAVVAPGLLSGDGLAASSVLGSAESGHDLGSSLLGAELELLLPLTVTEGTYSATLTLTALS